MGIFTDFDSFLFHQGTNYESYRKLGAHPATRFGDVIQLDEAKDEAKDEADAKPAREGAHAKRQSRADAASAEGVAGTQFVVWAPNAQHVAVITAATGWENEQAMQLVENGIWEAFVAGVAAGDAYRYVIVGADGVKRYKSDPYAFRSELRPNTASIVCGLEGYAWNDAAYQAARDNTTVLEKPMAIYEVHLGSWKKEFKGDGDADGFLNYRDLADQLAEYVTYMGYTHVELMGVCEHPFDGSWGYQVTGFFCPTARYGEPDDFRYLVDKLHQHGIGVILDWVPAHFPKDPFGLERFDGTPLFESLDPLREEYPEWGTKAFDHSKPEVRSFLISSAFYWIEEFHIDALRVDAVAAMIYANYSRTEWRPNVYGGYLNLESMDFLRQLNKEVMGKTTGYLIAEDSSTEWGITADVDEGGLGFMLKWNMGWMNDTLRYISKDPIYRRYHHEELVHTIDYAFSENFVLVLSHDEVVHLKRSLVEKMPGSIEDKLGCLKALYTLQFTHPGKKLLFMGQDFAQHSEWSEGRQIEWHLADDFGHRDIMRALRSLMDAYKSHPVLYSDSRDPATFEWVNRNDCWRNTISFIRRNPWNYDGAVLVICNFSPMRYDGYACGVPLAGEYRRVYSTYDSLPGCGGPDEIGGYPVLEATPEECDAREFRVTYNLRPYEAVIFEFPG